MYEEKIFQPFYSACLRRSRAFSARRRATIRRKTAHPDTPAEESSKEIFHEANGVIYGLTDYGKTLSKIEIPDAIDGEDIVSINEQAFYGCKNFTIVYYKGTESEWNNIAIYHDNDALTNATRYYYSESKPTTTGNYWRYVGGVPTPWEN